MIKKNLKFVADPTKGKVSAILEIPDASDALIVLGHGAGAGMHHANLENIAAALHRQRIATFRYQFPFRERGGGRDSQAVSLATVKNACDKAAELAPELTLFAGGHSFGGRMTTMASSESPLPTVEGLILFSFPLHPPGKPAIERAQHLDQVQVPMLFLSGTRDKLCTIELFKPVLTDLNRNKKGGTSFQHSQPATLHLLDTADHGYKTLKRSRQSTETVFDEMARVTREWIG